MKIKTLCIIAGLSGLTGCVVPVQEGAVIATPAPAVIATPVVAPAPVFVAPHPFYGPRPFFGPHRPHFHGRCR